MTERNIAIAGIVNAGTRSRFSRKLVHRTIASIRTHPLTKNVRLFYTAEAGDAEKLTRRALQRGFGLVLSIGGDGTHNEVVNGFFGQNGRLIRPSARLAVFPGGTGGDFRKTLGISTASDVLQALQAQRVRRLDVGRVGCRDRSGRPVGRHFINITSIGLGGLVDQYAADPRFQWLGGKGVYYQAVLRAFLRYRNPLMHIRLDQGPVKIQRACALVIANGRFFGGGMKVAPSADPHDGLLEAVCFGDFNLADFLLKGVRVYRGSHLGMAKVWNRKVRRVFVESQPAVQIDLDGEAVGFTPIDVSLASEKIPVYRLP